MTNNREAALIEVQRTLQDVITPLLEHNYSAANNSNRDINHRACDHLRKLDITSRSVAILVYGQLPHSCTKQALST